MMKSNANVPNQYDIFLRPVPLSTCLNVISYSITGNVIYNVELNENPMTPTHPSIAILMIINSS